MCIGLFCDFSIWSIIYFLPPLSPLDDICYKHLMFMNTNQGITPHQRHQSWNILKADIAWACLLLFQLHWVEIMANERST